MFIIIIYGLTIREYLISADKPTNAIGSLSCGKEIFGMVLGRDIFLLIKNQKTVYFSSSMKDSLYTSQLPCPAPETQKIEADTQDYLQLWKYRPGNAERRQL